MNFLMTLLTQNPYLLLFVVVSLAVWLCGASGHIGCRPGPVCHMGNWLPYLQNQCCGSLMGGAAGASDSGPAREAAAEIQSTVPWLEFPVDTRSPACY